MKKILTLITLLCSLIICNGCIDKKEQLYIYTWADYFDPELLQQFEIENNCELIIDTFDDNESMLAKLQAGATGYDIVMPTSYIIHTMNKHSLLAEFDMSLLPNVLENFDPKYNRFLLDNTLKMSIPYALSITGLAYRYDKLATTNNIEESWNIVFDERFNDRVCLLNDIREILGIGLLMNGKSVNSTNSADLKLALDYCKKMKDKAKKLDSVQYRSGLITAEYWLAMGYNSDMLQILDETPGIKLKFFIPKEGSTCGFDEFVLMKDAKNSKMAHKFVNFFYDPKIAAQNAEYICTSVPNKNIFEFLDDEFKTNDFTNPSEEILSRLELINDVGIHIDLYNSAWDEFMAISEK